MIVLSTERQEAIRHFILTAYQVLAAAFYAARAGIRGSALAALVALAYLLLTMDPATATFAEFLTVLQSEGLRRLIAAGAVLGVMTWGLLNGLTALVIGGPAIPAGGSRD